MGPAPFIACAVPPLRYRRMLSSFFSGAAHRPLGKIYLTAAILAICPGCLLIGRGHRQDIAVETDPPGATVRLEAQEILAPGKITVPRRSRPLAIVASAPGHETYSGELTSEASGLGVAVLETVLLLLPGLVDLGGPMYEWPHRVVVTLPPQGQGSPRLELDRTRPRKGPSQAPNPKPR